MYPHRIRLRGPWECEPAGRPPGRLTMPCPWGEGPLAGFAGRARLRRRFGYPGRIDAHERVWLVFAGARGPGEVSLNGVPLGALVRGGDWEHDVTNLLEARNELAVEAEGSPEEGGLWDEAALEVRRTAFLRDLRAWSAGTTLHVSGRVVGTADGPLELYAVLGRHTAAYEPVTPSAEGRPFHLEAAGLPAEWWREAAEGKTAPAVKVDLVGGGSVWYTGEEACASG